MFKWFYKNKNDDSGLLDNEVIATQNHVILNKMKYLEEKVGRLIDSNHDLEKKNHELTLENTKHMDYIRQLHQRIRKLEKTLSTCIVLEPNTPDIIVEDRVRR